MHIQLKPTVIYHVQQNSLFRAIPSINSSSSEQTACVSGSLFC